MSRTDKKPQGNDVAAHVAIDPATIADLCRRRNIRELALFGSVLREDFTETSDIDVLVDFEPGCVPGYLRMYDIEQELSQLFAGRQIDLVTRKSLHPKIRQLVLHEREVLYAQG